VARPRKEGVEAEAAAAAKEEEEEERRGREGGREGRGVVVVVVEERRRFKAVRARVGLLVPARVGTRRRAKAGWAAVWRSRKEALDDANIGARGGEEVDLGCLCCARPVSCAWVALGMKLRGASEERGRACIQLCCLLAASLL